MPDLQMLDIDIRRNMSTSNWQPISSAPFDHDLEVSVIEKGEVYPIIFPCRRASGGWIRASTGRPIFIDPTHWRTWSESQPTRD